MTLMLVVSSTLMAVLLPVASSTIRHAEETRALTDTAAIALQLNQGLNDMNYNRYSENGANNGTRVSLLVGDGDMPRECIAATGCGGGASTWDRLVTAGSPASVDFLERHMITNNPGGSSANDYPVTGANFWRGAYLNGPINPDPWGNRYMVNSQYFRLNASNVIVLSAGPNEIIETIFTDNFFVFPNPGGDDIASLVEL